MTPASRRVEAALKDLDHLFNRGFASVGGEELKKRELRTQDGGVRVSVAESVP